MCAYNNLCLCPYACSVHLALQSDPERRKVLNRTQLDALSNVPLEQVALDLATISVRLEEERATAYIEGF